MWWSTSYITDKYEPELDRDRKVTLTVGQLTDALAEALKVVTDAPSESEFDVGDEIDATPLVTGINGDTISFVIVGDDGHDRSNRHIKRNRLAQIRDAI